MRARRQTCARRYYTTGAAGSHAAASSENPRPQRRRQWLAVGVAIRGLAAHVISERMAQAAGPPRSMEMRRPPTADSVALGRYRQPLSIRPEFLTAGRGSRCAPGTASSDGA